MSSFRSSVIHKGKKDISGGHSFAHWFSAPPTSIPELLLCENKGLPVCGPTSQHLSRGKPRSYLTFPEIMLTHLHTAQCSPSRTGLYTGTDTRQRWCLSQTAAQLAVLLLASYTGYSESAPDPHKSDKRDDRLPREIQYREPSKGQIYVATKGSPSLNQNHLEKFTRYILSEYYFSGVLYKTWVMTIILMRGKMKVMLTSHISQVL